MEPCLGMRNRLAELGSIILEKTSDEWGFDDYGYDKRWFSNGILCCEDKIFNVHNMFVMVVNVLFCLVQRYENIKVAIKFMRKNTINYTSIHESCVNIRKPVNYKHV